MQKPRESKAEDMEEPTRVYFCLDQQDLGYCVWICLLAIFKAVEFYVVGFVSLFLTFLSSASFGAAEKLWCASIVFP